MKKIIRIIATLMLVLMVVNVSAATVLSAGDGGLKVRMLQRRLTELGYLSGDPTNIFDDATLNAVKAFQTDQGLVVDGVAGSATLSKLDLRLDGVNEVQVGQENDYVKTLQTKLANLGYYKGTIDGKYGLATRAAVMGFQRDKGIAVTGRMNSKTLELLDIGSPSIPNNRANSNKTLVREVQKALANAGLYTGKIDGMFGQQTLNALMSYQQANGLTVNGKMDQATLDKMGITISPNAKVILASNVRLKIGDKGNNVTILQKELKRLGYYGGKTDGKFGDATYLAVCSFQAKNSLTVDGVVGRSTINALNSGKAVHK